MDGVVETRTFRPAARAARRVLLIGWLAVAGGCAAQSEWVTIRSTPRNPLAQSLGLLSRSGPQPTPRTAQLLRRLDLTGQHDRDAAAALRRLMEIQAAEPNREVQYAIAELAYIAGQRAAKWKHQQEATAFYGTALLYAYDYLFELSGGEAVNTYDPQFRGASDLYNQSLEAMLRLVQAEGGLRPGSRRQVETMAQQCSFDIVLHSSGWHADDVDNLKFVSDYQIAGLRNHYHTYGLGVPLIAERRAHNHQGPFEQFYPKKLSFPLTAFLRVASPANARDAAPPRLVLELHDPLDRQTLQVAGAPVPLESDLSTPLAYGLSQPEFDIGNVSTLGLLQPDRVSAQQGLYMLEPFDPQKMPVVMVHGLWSSPVTWMEMFNDLRSDPHIRQHYQFWFYLYPTGQPFWVSGAQMRRDLAAARAVVDPAHERPALDQMVLVGHSMGGLVSKLQSVDSGDRFWATLSDRPYTELDADEELRRQLAQDFFFQPNPSIRRVVTIGTPHRGSKFANDLTQWAGRAVIQMPMKLVDTRQALFGRNQGFFRPNSPLDITTSLDSLDPQSKLLTTLRAAEPAPWVTYHNIIGLQPRTAITRLLSKKGDGVVSLASAELDGLPRVDSQLVVEADHLNVHRHPRSVLEVRRVLLLQLAELQQFPYGPGDIQVAVESPPRALHEATRQE